MTDQLFLMLWFSGVVFGLGVLALIPIFLRGRRTRRGEFLPIDQTDVTQRNIAGGLLVFGTMGLFTTAMLTAKQSLSFGAFIALCGVVTAIVLAIAFRVDAVRARRHH